MNGRFVFFILLLAISVSNRKFVMEAVEILATRAKNAYKVENMVTRHTYKEENALVDKLGFFKDQIKGRVKADKTLNTNFVNIRAPKAYDTTYMRMDFNPSTYKNVRGQAVREINEEDQARLQARLELEQNYQARDELEEIAKSFETTYIKNKFTLTPEEEKIMKAFRNLNVETRESMKDIPGFLQREAKYEEMEDVISKYSSELIYGKNAQVGKTTARGPADVGLGKQANGSVAQGQNYDFLNAIYQTAGLKKPLPANFEPEVKGVVDYGMEESVLDHLYPQYKGMASYKPDFTQLVNFNFQQTGLTKFKEQQKRIANLQQDPKEIANIRQEQTSLANLQKEKTGLANLQQEQKGIANIRKEQTSLANVQQQQTALANLQQEQTGLANFQQEQKGIANIRKEQTSLANLQQEQKGVMEIPQQQTDLRTIIDQETRLTTIPKQQTNLALIPEKKTDLTVIPKQQTNLALIPEKKTDLTIIPKQQTNLALIPEKKTDLLVIPEKQTALVPPQKKSNLFSRYNTAFLGKYSYLNKNPYSNPYLPMTTLGIYSMLLKQNGEKGLGKTPATQPLNTSTLTFNQLMNPYSVSALWPTMDPALLKVLQNAKVDGLSSKPLVNPAKLATPSYGKSYMEFFCMKNFHKPCADIIAPSEKQSVPVKLSPSYIDAVLKIEGSDPAKLKQFMDHQQILKNPVALYQAALISQLGIPFIPKANYGASQSLQPDFSVPAEVASKDLWAGLPIFADHFNAVGLAKPQPIDLAEIPMKVKASLDRLSVITPDLYQYLEKNKEKFQISKIEIKIKEKLGKWVKAMIITFIGDAVLEKLFGDSTPLDRTIHEISEQHPDASTLIDMVYYNLVLDCESMCVEELPVSSCDAFSQLLYSVGTSLSPKEKRDFALIEGLVKRAVDKSTDEDVKLVFNHLNEENTFSKFTQKAQAYRDRLEYLTIRFVAQ